MKKLLLFACMSIVYQLHAQTFYRNLSIPVSDNNNRQYKLPWSGGFNSPLFSEIDLNADGVQDLFVFDRTNNRIATFLQSGSGAGGWTYAPQYVSGFPALNGWAYLIDYNCDGKPDLFTVSNANNGIAQYRNDSQGGNLSFTLVNPTVQATSQFGSLNIFASAYLVPNLNDIDGDGDLDILGQQFQCVGGFAYYRNRSVEDFGVCDSLNKYELITNSWGRFTIRPGSYNYVAVGSYNVSCRLANPFLDEINDIARRDDTFANIFTIDIDGDHDMDAIVGDSQTNNSLLVINGGDSLDANMISQDTLFPSYDTPVNIKSFSTHAYVDADNDGLKDLLVSQSEFENYAGVFLYKNTGTNASPVFNFQQNDFLVDEMIDWGEGSAPVFFDYNNDGLLDLVIGNKGLSNSSGQFTTGLMLFENIGTTTNPSFKFITNDYAGIQSLNLASQITPAFGDLDGDRDSDMLLGADNGKIYYFQNLASPGSLPNFTFVTASYMSIDVGNGAAPQLVDLNRDGKLDLVVGEKNGFLNYFENVGMGSATFFTPSATTDTLGGIVLQATNSVDGYTSPFFFQQNGDLRLLVSSMDGSVLLYDNIDGNLTGNFTVLDTVIAGTSGNRYGNNLYIGGGDIDGDSLTDFVLGLFSGGVELYTQQFSNSISSLTIDKQFKVFPNPSAGAFTVKYNADQFSVNVFDQSGRMIANTTGHAGFASLNLNDVSDGIYFVRINGVSQTVRLILIRP